MIKQYKFKELVLFLCVLSALILLPSSVSSNETQKITGHLFVIWGDDIQGASYQQFYIRQDQSLQIFELVIDENSTITTQNLQSLNGKLVTAIGLLVSNMENLHTEQSILLVQKIQPLESSLQDTNQLLDGVYGSQPWVSILCKFADITDEPKPVSYFNNQYSSVYPGLDLYWREASYNAINLQGSLAVGWFTLPHPRSYYIYDSNNDGKLEMNFNTITQDCVDLADPMIYFPEFKGINLMFNYELDNNAWGGGWYITVDGVSRTWPMTWEPPWGYNQTVIAHEMGHSFGFPHAAVFGRPYGQGQGDRWDIMGDGWYDCANSTDATYGCLPQHTASYHKDLANWIPSNRKYVAQFNSQQTIIIERLTQPPVSNYLLLQIPILGSSSHFYTVESRKRIGFDVKLPSEGVIIHEVYTTRAEPSHLIDIDNNGDTGDGGVIWTPGETFTDISNHTQVTVDAATGTGYRVTVAILPGFCDAFSEPVLNNRWQWVDPLGDSLYALAGSQLELSTPDGEHDLYFNHNAPRLVQPVIGDFTLKTKVNLNSDYIYQGAGILIWQDQNNYFRFEKANSQHGICFWYNINGIYDGLCLPYQDDTIYLKVRRIGDTIQAFSSTDDVNWSMEKQIIIPFKPRVQVGLNLINQWQDNPVRASFESVKFDWCGENFDLPRVYLPMIAR